jgi:PhoH-like ATPase
MIKKTYLLDTNVYMTSVEAIYSFGEHNIVIPTVVLDEIDKHKHRQDLAGANARRLNRLLDDLRSVGSLNTGVELKEGRGNVRVIEHHPNCIPIGLKSDSSDNKIIGAALTLLDNDLDVIVVSRDINLRVKCDAYGITCEDYELDKVVESADEMYGGIEHRSVPYHVIDSVYVGQGFIDDSSLFPNQYLVLTGEDHPKKSALVRYNDQTKFLMRLTKRKPNSWGFSARNKEQEFALDALYDSGIDVVSLVGRAGTGKTLLALAAGLDQVLGRDSDYPYKKLIVTKPIEPVGKDIGFLPGTIEDKLMPWLAPIKDNLESLIGDRTAMEMYMEQGTIEIEAMTFIRGRSISNAYIIVDEAQNMTAHEIKTILTRVGEGTKIILTGDVQQIDNSYVDAESNGLTYVVEKFKPYDITAHVTLTKGERSRLATLSADIL